MYLFVNARLGSRRRRPPRENVINYLISLFFRLPLLFFSRLGERPMEPHGDHWAGTGFGHVNMIQLGQMQQD